MGTKFSVKAVFDAEDNISVSITKMDRKVESFANKASRNLSALDGKLSKISSGFKVAGAAALAAGAGLGFAAKAVVDGGGGFEQAITNVGAVSLMTREEVKDLELAALKLGKSTKYSATEVASGMELMGKAGFTNAQVLKGIPSLLAAAAAEGAEFEETAGTISNTLKGMGLDVNEAGRVADVLTLASARTNSSISSLGESMKNVSPVARQFKIPMEHAVTAVALLQDVGLDASEAGTATATMLTKLAKPTDDVAAKMASLGVKFRDAKGDMLPLPMVLEQFSKAAAKSKGNMKTVAFFADLVGLRGQKAALNLQELFKNGSFEKLAAELKYAAGSAEQMASIRMDTFQGDMKLLENTIDDVKIALFDTQSGPLRGIVQDTTKWIAANKDLIVSGVNEFVVKLRDNFEDIVIWGKRIGYTVATFYALSAAVKVGLVAIEGYKAGAAIIRGAGTAAAWSAGKLGLFEKAAMAGEKPLKGLLMGVQYSKASFALDAFSKKVGVSKLGILGMAAAAFSVGYAIGTWINKTWGLDEKISGWVAKLTGVEDQLNGLGGRSNKPGLEKGGPQHLADGTILDGKTGAVIKAGSDVEGVLQRRRDRLRGEVTGTALAGGMSLSTGAAATAARLNADWQSKRTDVPLFRPAESQVVTPQERSIRSVYESTEQQQITLNVKSEPGTTVTEDKQARKGKKRARVNLPATGGF